MQNSTQQCAAGGTTSKEGYACLLCTQPDTVDVIIQCGNEICNTQVHRQCAGYRNDVGVHDIFWICQGCVGSITSRLNPQRECQKKKVHYNVSTILGGSTLEDTVNEKVQVEEDEEEPEDDEEVIQAHIVVL